MSSVSKFVEVITRCEATGKKAIKFEALGELDEIGKRLVVEALSPYRVFGVKKYDMPTYYAIEDSTDVEGDFISVLDKLASRKLTGNAAKTAIQSALMKFTAESAKILARIIDKDLRGGFSAETVNKVFPELVPYFDVMLAIKFDTDEEVKSNTKFPCIAEAKYDGERNVAFVELAEAVVPATKKAFISFGANVDVPPVDNSPKFDIRYLSRSGKEASHMAGLIDEDLIKLRNYFGEDIVVDGERYASNFTETMNAKKSGDSTAKANMRFHAFFIMTVSEWKSRNCPLTMLEQRERMITAIHEAGCVKIIPSIGKIVNTPEEAEAFYKEQVADGFEGLILKQIDAKYEWARSKNWVKWKPFFDFDGKIVGFYFGKAGKRLENVLGGITIEGFDEQGRHILTNVGTGFSDEQRKHIMENQEEYLGKIAEVRYQEITKGELAEDTWALRFSSFQRIRQDRLV